MSYADMFCFLGVCYGVAKGFWGAAKNVKEAYSRGYQTVETVRFLRELELLSGLFMNFERLYEQVMRLQDKYKMQLCTMVLAKSYLKTTREFLEQFEPGKGILPASMVSTRVFEIKDAMRLQKDVKFYGNMINGVVVQLQTELLNKSLELNMIKNISEPDKQKASLKRFRTALKCPMSTVSA